MFTIEALPARDGDCIWVEWGDPDQPYPHRMLIDAGRSGRRPPRALEAKILALPEDQRVFDLVVATHIDVDHVQGLVPLFADPPAGFGARSVWFNGRQHLPEDVFGHLDGDRLSTGIEQLAPEAWNREWTEEPFGAVAVPSAPDPLPTRTIEGLRITLLSPSLPGLAALAAEWPQVVEEAELQPNAVSEDPPEDDLLGEPTRDVGIPLRTLAGNDDDDSDTTASNGSSIAFLAEYDGQTVLLAADAHSDQLEAGLARVDHGAPVPLRVCKVPHHGSRNNVKPAWLRLVDCQTWMISTDSSHHDHPDRRAIARLLARGPNQTLIFNYDTVANREYGLFSTAQEFGHVAWYPQSKAGGIKVVVTPELEVIGSRRP